MHCHRLERRRKMNRLFTFVTGAVIALSAMFVQGQSPNAVSPVDKSPSNVEISATPFAIQEEFLGEKGLGTPADDKWDIASSDGARVAWRDKQGEKWVVLVNGEQAGGRYDNVEWVIFSPNSEHIAYRAKTGTSWVMVVDGRPGPAYREIEEPRFSRDSQHFAYPAKKGDKWLVEPVSKIPQHDFHAAQPDHTEEILDVIFPAVGQAAIDLQPGKQPLDGPPSAVTA
jgi:hypothetical protein